MVLAKLNTEISSEDYLTKTLWRARLSNGIIAVQEGVETESSWLCLKRYVEENNLRIESVWVAFRDHVVSNFMPSNADGYFIIKQAIAHYGCPITFHYYVFGYLDNGKVHCTKYKIPELIQVEKEIREPEQCLEGLILNRK